MVHYWAFCGQLQQSLSLIMSVIIAEYGFLSLHNAHFKVYMSVISLFSLPPPQRLVFLQRLEEKRQEWNTLFIISLLITPFNFHWKKINKTSFFFLPLTFSLTSLPALCQHPHPFLFLLPAWGHEWRVFVIFPFSSTPVCHCVLPARNNSPTDPSPLPVGLVRDA